MRMFSLGLVAFAATGPALAEPPSEFMVDGIMSRALLERGGFHACAALEPDGAALREQIEKVWALDLADVAERITSAGMPAPYIAALPERYVLDIGVPSLADGPALDRFCAMLGDWKQRYYTFDYLSPQLDIGRRVAQ